LQKTYLRKYYTIVFVIIIGKIKLSSLKNLINISICCHAFEK